MYRYFDSLSAAPGIHSPLLCLVGEDHSLLLHEKSSWADSAVFLGRLVAGSSGAPAQEKNL
ncbi:MAG: hypothetical protein LUO80_08475 [Methylococcaceae bacterium]|nr:hypothetical protein [Methylococcaceae bacterium]